MRDSFDEKHTIIVRINHKNITGRDYGITANYANFVNCNCHITIIYARKSAPIWKRFLNLYDRVAKLHYLFVAAIWLARIFRGETPYSSLKLRIKVATELKPHASEISMLFISVVITSLAA